MHGCWQLQSTDFLFLTLRFALTLTPILGGGACSDSKCMLAALSTMRVMSVLWIP